MKLQRKSYFCFRDVYKRQEHDYLTDGFWAKNRGEELPTPGLKFQFVDRIEDITDIVNQKIEMCIRDRN